MNICKLQTFCTNMEHIVTQLSNQIKPEKQSVLNQETQQSSSLSQGNIMMPTAYQNLINIGDREKRGTVIPIRHCQLYNLIRDFHM